MFAGGAIFGAACYHIWAWRHPKTIEVVKEKPVDIPMGDPFDHATEELNYVVDDTEEDVPVPTEQLSVDENGALEVIEDYEEVEVPKRYDIPPYEISQETFANPFPKFDKVFLYYDADEDQFVVPETGTPVEDPYQLLGADNIGMFIDTDVEFLYVRNENLSTDYELFK